MSMEVRTRDEGGRPLPALVWDLPEPMLAISSGPLGGGIGLRRWVLNAQVSSGYDRPDPADHLAAMAVGFGLGGKGVGVMTAANVAAVRKAGDGGVSLAATVGVRDPQWAAASPAPAARVRGAPPAPTARADGFAVSPGTINPGTINLVAFVPERLSAAALVNAVATATEAKVQALWAAGILATGTATDAVCVLCPVGGPAHPYGGPRSHWGSRLARAVRDAVAAGVDPVEQ